MNETLGHMHVSSTYQLLFVSEIILILYTTGL